MSKKGTEPSLSYNLERAELGEELGSCFAPAGNGEATPYGVELEKVPVFFFATL